MYALQMVDLLLAKLPGDYDFIFRREGVKHEVNRPRIPLQPEHSLPSRRESQNVPVGGSRSESHMSATSNMLDEELLQVPSSLGRHSSSIHAFSSASTSSSSTSTKDQLIYRARHLKAKCVMAETTASIRAQEILGNIRRRCQPTGNRSNYRGGAFELLESGLVGGFCALPPSLDLLDVSAMSCLHATVILSETFFSSSELSPAFLLLVKRLQESLGRLEGFEVLTAVASTPDDSRRSIASMLARQLKIRLVAAESTDVPRNCANIVVSIHAIGHKTEYQISS
ncbi:hypothetical protein PSTT_17157, partial [Puccinia striiformis]